MKELEYPFDPKWIIKKKKSIKKQLLEDKSNNFICKKVAILGGSTTNEIKDILEIFLLNYGIKADFYESEYNKFYEEGAFKNEKLIAFNPDIVYICTTIKNILEFPKITDTKEHIDEMVDLFYKKYVSLWTNISKEYKVIIIQNNFEYPSFRILGNKDVSDLHGRVNFVSRLNELFSEYAANNSNFYICDINYLSASIGLNKWYNNSLWYMYKYALDLNAVPFLSFNVANIIKSIYGKNKKVLNLDLDNTLWGGVIGDDGFENIEIGKENAVAENYTDFQKYIKLYKDMGILLTLNSKNDENVAIKGLERPDSILKEDDFINKKINWNPKNQNLLKTAEELSLLPESFVFIDDNPAERQIIIDSVEGAAVPEINNVEDYIDVIDKSGFFEVTNMSDDDIKRNDMYISNVKREESKKSFTNYKDYLISLNMKSEIKSFEPMYLSRIAQLTNKSNQFNLTTKRYSLKEIEDISNDNNYITLYGKLIDKFGDNGVVSVIIGKIDHDNKEFLHIELWLMSCRVLKRDMEYAMMDELVNKAKESGIKKLIGYYFPTEKNNMVKDFYLLQGFNKIKEDKDGNAVYEFNITDNYQKKQDIIEIIKA